MKPRLFAFAPRIALGLALAWGLGPVSALASKTVNFTLSNESGESVPRVDFHNLPAGSVVPKILGHDEHNEPIEGSPLTPLDSSEGVDIENVVVLLGTEEAPDGGPEQESLFLLFGFTTDHEASGEDPPFLPIIDEQGQHVGLLDVGGHFDFELNLASNDLADRLLPITPGLDLLALTAVEDLDDDDLTPRNGSDGDSDGGLVGPIGDPGEVTVIPEPTTMLLWSALAGTGLLYARRQRRRSNQDGA